MLLLSGPNMAGNELEIYYRVHRNRVGKQRRGLCG